MIVRVEDKTIVVDAIFYLTFLFASLEVCFLSFLGSIWSFVTKFCQSAILDISDLLTVLWATSLSRKVNRRKHKRACRILSTQRACVLTKFTAKDF